MSSHYLLLRLCPPLSSDGGARRPMGAAACGLGRLDPSGGREVARASADSGIFDLVGEQSEGLIDPDPVNRLPVLGDESLLDAEEVERGEVRWPAALGDGAVPHASGGEAVVFGDHVRLQDRKSV